ncbi:MAG TPA: hypothetical protein VNU28_06505 [Solirubrobacteraceae bacterium]|nr:hypothetical protein [Solirubrobacteraceae bacterium]
MRDHTEAGEDPATLRPYEAIHEHAELELELAGRGEIERIAALGERWEELTRGLPARPPAAALALLQQARLLHERTRIELIRVRESLLSDISSASRARRAADGYGGQHARRPYLDRSA